MRVALVAAVAENGVIGAAGALPWRIGDDLKWFKKTTMGKPVVMGRKTYESVGKPLPGRDNIIVTRDESFSGEGIIVENSVDAAMARAGECAKARGADEICVIGGADIYAQTLALAERIYLTRVKATVAGDVRFPPIDADDWTATVVGECIKSERNQYACEFVILNRVVAEGQSAPN